MSDCKCKEEPTEFSWWLAEHIGTPILRYLDRFAPYIECLTAWLVSLDK